MTKYHWYDIIQNDMESKCETTFYDKKKLKHSILMTFYH